MSQAANTWPTLPPESASTIERMECGVLEFGERLGIRTSFRAGRWWRKQDADKASCFARAEGGIHFTPGGGVKREAATLLREVLPAAGV